MPTLTHRPGFVNAGPAPARADAPSDRWLRTHCYVCSEPVADPAHQGMTAKCPRCRLYLGGGADPLDVAKIRRRELAEARVEPTAADWDDYGLHLDDADRRWWAAQDPEAHTAEPTPLDVLDALAPFDWDAPNPATEIDWDDLYGGPDPDECPALLGIGHPAAEA